MRTFSLAIAAFALSAPAAAQDGSEAVEKRTVEGAQKFLEAFYGRGGAQASIGIVQNGHEWFRGFLERPGFKWASLRGDVIALTSEGRCAARLTFINPKLDSHQLGVPNAIFPLARGKADEKVDWTKVVSIKVAEEERGDGQGNRVGSGWWRINVLYNDRTSVWFYHLTEEAARRAGAAMEFLRITCDPVSEAAF